jgi:hypothetical protein
MKYRRITKGIFESLKIVVVPMETTQTNYGWEVDEEGVLTERSYQ